MLLTCPNCGGQVLRTRDGWYCLQCSMRMGVGEFCHLLPEVKRLGRLRKRGLSGGGRPRKYRRRKVAVG